MPCKLWFISPNWSYKKVIPIYIPTYNDLLWKKLIKTSLLVFNRCQSERQKRRSIFCFNTYVLKLTIFIDTYWSLACFLWRIKLFLKKKKKRIKLFLFFAHFVFSFNRCSFMSSFSPWLYMLSRYSNQRLYTCFTHFHSIQSIQRLYIFIVYIEIHWKWNEMKYVASKMNVNVTQRISGRVPMLNKTRQSIQTLVWPNNFKQ